MRFEISHIISQAFKKAQRTYHDILKWYESLPFWKKGATLAGLLSFVALVIVMLANFNRILGFYVWLSGIIRESHHGALILWLGIIVVSFPPLVGLSGFCTLSGMVYGMSLKSWILVTSATAVGSTLSFLLFKYLLERQSRKLLETSRLFLAFSTVLSQDKNKFLLLCLLQWCPRPYSITNAAFASIPGLSATNFMLSGLAASPKYAMMIFVGYKMEHMGETKDTITRIIDVLSILLTSSVSAVTSYLIYRKTTQSLAALGGQIDVDEFEELEIISEDSEGLNMLVV